MAMNNDGTVTVRTERLVRLQRKIYEYHLCVLTEPYRVRNGLRKLYEEVDRIVLGEPGAREEDRKYDSTD